MVSSKIHITGMVGEAVCLMRYFFWRTVVSFRTDTAVDGWGEWGDSRYKGGWQADSSYLAVMALPCQRSTVDSQGIASEAGGREGRSTQVTSLINGERLFGHTTLTMDRKRGRNGGWPCKSMSEQEVQTLAVPQYDSACTSPIPLRLLVS